MALNLSEGNVKANQSERNGNGTENHGCDR